ncbi:unnamed protein product, partial [Ectocarpus sp. 12 AP-2014]
MSCLILPSCLGSGYGDRKHTVDETPRPKHWSQQQTARALECVPSDLCGKGR